jgi:hypothetical protein
VIANIGAFLALLIYGLLLALLLEKRMERRLTALSNSTRATNALLRRLRERLGVRIPTPKDLQEAEDAHRSNDPEGRALTPEEAAEQTADHVAEQIVTTLTAPPPPPLRRVIWFSMWMSREFTKEVVGLTDAELEEVKDQVAPARFWPSTGTTLEQWTTHMAVFDRIEEGYSSKYRFTLYEPISVSAPTVLCSHRFGSAAKGPSAGALLEIVLHDNAIKCWGREGRFQGKYWFGEAEDRNIFINIPLHEEQLRPHLRSDEHLGDDGPVGLEPPYKTIPWYGQYTHDDPRGYGWTLTVTNFRLGPWRE